jgi:putative transposase
VSEQKIKNRRSFSAEFKAKVTLELIRGDMSLSQASAKYEVKESVLSRWKQEFLERAALVFAGSPSEQDLRVRELERQLKEQSTDLAILKKALLLFPSPSEPEQ